MACIIKSVSITEEENQFLRDYKLSPSQLIKEQIWKMKGMMKSLAGEKIAKQTSAIEFYLGEIDRLKKIMEEHGILE